MHAFADDTSQSPVFLNLKDALVFIDTALDKNDWAGLTKALYPPFQPNDPNRDGWKQLKDERGKTRLADDFSDKNFPASGNTLDIGASSVLGPPRPLLIGWSRINFIKTADGWHLNAIYGVR
jgi:hypothetical protein